MRFNKKFRDVFLYPFAMTVLIPIVAILIRVLRFTWRTTTLNSFYGERRPLLVALPHQEILVALSELALFKDVVVLQSPSKDGQLGIKLVRMFGNDSIVGSSNKNPVRAMFKVIESLKENKIVVITFDGPRGPALQMTSGICYAAAVMQTPILLGMSKCDAVWRIKSWDRTKVPKPFSKVILDYNTLFDPPKTTEPEEIARVRDLIQTQIDKLVANKY